MSDKNTKAVIKKHLESMFIELDEKQLSLGWFPEQGADILAEIIYSTLAYGEDIEKYMEKEGMVKEDRLRFNP